MWRSRAQSGNVFISSLNHIRLKETNRAVSGETLAIEKPTENDAIISGISTWSVTFTFGGKLMCPVLVSEPQSKANELNAFVFLKMH